MTSMITLRSSGMVAGLGILGAVAAICPAHASEMSPRPAPVHRETSRVIKDTAASVAPQELTAGPIRCKFADGELRYLYVGDREIVRRVYFAVRDGSWNTAMPAFTKMELHKTDNGFVIDLAADCKTETADFSWTGRIEGNADGRITFKAGGAANHAFRSNRIGLCVLYGAPALAGHPFETVGRDGATRAMVFPEYVSPALVAPDFLTLKYTADGIAVDTTVSGDARFDMEDQRTYSDSSFKAYAPLSYDYKQDIPAGRMLQQTVTLTASSTEKGKTLRPALIPSGTVLVSVGDTIPGATMPKVTQVAPEAKAGLFGDVNNHSAKFKGLPALTWGFSPDVHLPDADVKFENIVSIPDQVKTAHQYAPGATITLSPISLPCPGRWPKSYEPAADDPLPSAWSAAMIGEAASAGVVELSFRTGPGLGRMAQDSLAEFAGKPLRKVTVNGPKPSPVVAFAAEGDSGTTVIWLVNQTNRPQHVAVLNVLTDPVKVQRINRVSVAGAQPVETGHGRDGSLMQNLAPYEVCRVEVQKP